ncbi:MAG: hypothetical protein H6767_00365 [Candidatus Peribacteria bacterium]|nr:MAG: hypothetical protein H6767_00365 [Candidatus Peribacteria bacterium]
MNGEGLVRSSLERIMRMREILQTREIFGEFDLFHIAHFGQDVGVDYSGTTVTQNALRYQAGERKYTLFDAQNINGEEIWK